MRWLADLTLAADTELQSHYYGSEFLSLFTILCLPQTSRPCGFLTNYLDDLLSGSFLCLVGSACLLHF